MSFKYKAKSLGNVNVDKSNGDLKYAAIAL